MDHRRTTTSSFLRLMSGRALALGFAIATAVIGCQDRGPKPPKPEAPCVPPTIDAERSLVIHDPALLASRFPLQKTLQKIVDTSLHTNPATPQDLLQTMLDSFQVTTSVQPISGRTLPLDALPQEASLSTADLLNPGSPNGMVPTGLFNRFDLAPEDASNCGEYRIVYAKKSTSPLDRFLMIFEAKVPNPTPLAGIKGCKPIVDFWATLPADPVQRITKLESFYYQGLPGFAAVVDHANYGMPLGQVRTNLFVSQPNFHPWLLREHRTSLQGGVPVFLIDTNKENPLAEWYRTGALPGNTTAADRAAFRDHFLGQPICNLVSPELKMPGATPAQIVNGIGSKFDPTFNEFQSVSSNSSDDPTANTDPSFAAAMAGRLGALGTSTVDTTQLLTRAGAMTCGGCHQFAAGKPIGSGATWPAVAPGGFVHIDENGALSEALTSFFLPERGRILSRFVCDPTSEAKPMPACSPPAMPMARAAVARRPATMPTPNAALASALGLDAATVARLKQGRVTATLQEIDIARLAALAAARAQAAPARGAADSAARRTLRQAEETLRRLIEQARMQEEAQPGAFVGVRRTH